MDNGLGNTDGSHDPKARDSGGTTTEGLPPSVTAEESRGNRRMRKPSFIVHSYPWYVSSWRGSEMRMRLSPIGRYVYRELIDHCYIEGSLPGDTAILAKIADISLREFLKVWPEVSRAFRQSDDGRWHNPKVDEVLPELERWHEKKRIAGRAGGLAKRSNALAVLQQNGSNAVASLKPSTSTSTSTELPPTPIDDLYEEFWRAYPERGKKKPGSVERWYAYNLGSSLNPQKLHREIMDGLERAKRSAWWEKEDGKYICGALSFLEGKRWKESWPESDGGYETPLTDLRDLD